MEFIRNIITYIYALQGRVMTFVKPVQGRAQGNTLFNSGRAQGPALHWMVVLAMLLCLNSCTSDDTEDNGKTVRVQLTITVGESATANGAKANTTRAIDDANWGGNYDKDAGTTAENTIDPNKLHIVLYNSNGDYVAQLENMVVTSTGTTGQYRVLGDINISTLNITNNTLENARVTVYANIDVPTGGWTQTATNFQTNSTFNYTGFSSSSIPMWGTKTATLNLNGGSSNDLNDIYLLRAVAKVRVQLSSDMTNYTLESVTLNRYNTTGYCLPKNINVNNTQVLTTETDAANTMSFNPTSDVSTESIPFSLSSDETSTLDLYIPEYDNISTGATASTISVRLKQGGTSEGVTYTFGFDNYTDGAATNNPYNIIRNHYYNFTVYKQNGMRVILKVVPWTVFNHSVYTL